MSVCNPFVCGLYGVTINVAQVPRPPVIAPQNRSIPEGPPAGTTLSPAVFASHPQGLAVNFSVIPATVFGISASTGVLFLQSGQSLVFATQSTYSLTVLAVSSAGTQASAPLSVIVTQINKPPVFNLPVFSLSVNESAPAGVSFGSAPASSTNIPDTLTYSIASVVPAGALSWFAIDAASAALFVAPGISGGALLVDTGLTYPAGPWTVNVSLRVRNAGGLTANATALVTVRFIAPRITAFPVNATARNNASAFTPVTALRPAVWTPYSYESLVYSIASASTAAGSTAFIANSSGSVFVANLTYPRETGAFDAQPWLYSLWTVADSSTGLSATGGLNVTVLPSNRAPFWTSPKSSSVIYAPQRRAGPFGVALGPLVTDADTSSGVGETLTFSLVAATNPGGVFSIDPSSGQLSVANQFSSVVQTPGSNTTITVAVRDAGINGPIFWAYANFTISIVISAYPPNITAAAFSVPELSAVGTFVGNITASSLNYAAIMSYTLSPQSASDTCPFAIASVLTSTAAGPVQVCACLFSLYESSVMLYAHTPPRRSASSLLLPAQVCSSAPARASTSALPL